MCVCIYMIKDPISILSSPNYPPTSSSSSTLPPAKHTCHILTHTHTDPIWPFLHHCHLYTIPSSMAEHIICFIFRISIPIPIPPMSPSFFFLNPNPHLLNFPLITIHRWSIRSRARKLGEKRPSPEVGLLIFLPTKSGMSCMHPSSPLN